MVQTFNVKPRTAVEADQIAENHLSEHPQTGIGLRMDFMTDPSKPTL